MAKQKKGEDTLTRGQAHQLVSDALVEVVTGGGDMKPLLDLQEHWIGHRDLVGDEKAEDVADLLHGFVDEVAFNGDSQRSNGPQDSDPTDLTEIPVPLTIESISGRADPYVGVRK